jgi:mRNA interferase MazF
MSGVDVFLVKLNPSRGGKIQKTRPCVVVSPNELNAYLRTFIVAPFTTGGHPYPIRVSCWFEGRAGYVVIDQICTVDRDHLVRRLGRLSQSTLGRILAILQEMFALTIAHSNMNLPPISRVKFPVHRGASRARQWRTECEQRKFYSDCVPSCLPDRQGPILQGGACGAVAGQ